MNVHEGLLKPKRCMFVHLLLCSNAPWLHTNLYCSISHCLVKMHTFMDIYFVCVCVRESERACALSNVCPAVEVSQGGIYHNLTYCSYRTGELLSGELRGWKALSDICQLVWLFWKTSDERVISACVKTWRIAKNINIWDYKWMQMQA